MRSPLQRMGRAPWGFQLCQGVQRPRGSAFPGNSGGKWVGAGSRGEGGRRGGAGPAAVYKEGGPPATATRLRDLSVLWYYGPRLPAPAAAAAPRGLLRRCRGVGRCLEMAGGGGADRCLLCSWERGIGLIRSQGDIGARETLLETWTRGHREASEGGSFARPAPPACCSSRLPLTSGRPRAPGSDVTKPVSPSPPPHPVHTLSPFPWCSWDRLGASNPPPRFLGAQSGQR